jgi:uncharacterized protein
VTIPPESGRVLGCLVEKQLTTPQQYPLTLNALSLACNQATSREPVMAMDEDAVVRALHELKALHLVRFVLPSHGKSVTRYRHVLDEAYGLDTQRVALMAVLVLRGPQTLAELRTRTGRMAEFDSPGAVQAELEVLAVQPEPLVRLLSRQPGQKEDRWQQLLVEESIGPTASSRSEPEAVMPSGDRAPTGAQLANRVAILEAEVAALRDQIGELGDSLTALRHSLGG